MGLPIYYCSSGLVDKLPSALSSFGYSVTVDGEKVTIEKDSTTFYMLVGDSSVLFVFKRKWLSTKKSEALAEEVIQILNRGNPLLKTNPKTSG